MRTAESWANEWREVAKDRPSTMSVTLECFIRDIQRDAMRSRSALSGNPVRVVEDVMQRSQWVMDEVDLTTFPSAFAACEGVVKYKSEGFNVGTKVMVSNSDSSFYGEAGVVVARWGAGPFYICRVKLQDGGREAELSEGDLSEVAEPIC